MRKKREKGEIKAENRLQFGYFNTVESLCSRLKAKKKGERES